MSAKDPFRRRLLLPGMQLQEGNLWDVREKDNLDEILQAVSNLIILTNIFRFKLIYFYFTDKAN